MTQRLSHKVASLNVSTSGFKPNSSVTYSVTAPTASRFVSSATVKQSTIHLEETLKDIKRRYEDEARHVQHSYEVDYNNHLSLVKALEEVEILLEEERRRNFDLGNLQNETALELERERRLRIDYEQELTVLKDHYRRLELVNSEDELKISRLQNDITHMDSENKSLRVEIHRLTDLYNAKIRDCEERYLIQVRDLTCDVDKLRLTLEQQRSDYENRIHDLEREHGLRYTRLDERCKDRERHIAELEAELRGLTDHIAHTKLQHEEEIRRQINITREEEQHKYHIALKNLEAKMQQILDERDLLIRKNQELVRDIHLRERQIQDYRIQFEGESGRLKNDINDLRNQLSLLNATADKLRGEVANRDTMVARLESEICNLQREAQRMNDIHTTELNRLLNDEANERRRWEEVERILKAKISDLERIIRSLESDNLKLRADLEKLKEQIAGNVHKTIFQTFVDYDTVNVNSANTSKIMMKSIY